MAKFFRKNKKELIVSLILSVVFYFVLNLFMPLQLACPIGQQIQCILYAWIIFLLVVLVLFVLIFLIIKLVELMIRMVKPKQSSAKKKSR